MPAFSAIGAWAYHSYCARHSLAVHRMANSDSRGGSAVLYRQWAPSACASCPYSGACSQAAKGPRKLIDLPRGPERKASISERWASFICASSRTARRGVGRLAGMGVPFGFLAGRGQGGRDRPNIAQAKADELVVFGRRIVRKDDGGDVDHAA